MNDGRDDGGEQLSPREREALAALPRERTPRPGIEDAIVAELRRSGRVRGRRWGSIAAAVAAALLLVMGAWWGGRATAPAVPQAKWILLLHDAPSVATLSSEESTRRVQEYGKWARAALSRGLLDGEKLGDDGTWMHATSSGIESRPLLEGEDSLGGFFLLGEMDEAHARDLASTCPHLRHGGVLELRRIDS